VVLKRMTDRDNRTSFGVEKKGIYPREREGNEGKSGVTLYLVFMATTLIPDVFTHNSESKRHGPKFFDS